MPLSDHEPVSSQGNDTITVKRTERRKTLAIAFGFIVITAALVLGTLYALTADPAEPTAEASSLLASAGFPVYYYVDKPPKGFQLDSAASSVSQDVIILTLVNGKQKVTVAQQRIGSEMSPTDYPNAEKVEGADGEGLISFDGTRPIGALFGITDDTKPADEGTAGKSERTLVLLNPNDQVRAETMRELVRELRLLQPPLPR